MVERGLEQVLRPVCVGISQPVGNLVARGGVGVDAVGVGIGCPPFLDAGIAVVRVAARGRLRVQFGDVVQFHEVGGAGHQAVVGHRLLRSKHGIERHAGLFVVLTLFGGNQDNAVCRARTVDGSRAGILQDGDTLDVVGVQRSHVGLHTVHDNQRAAVVERAGTTYLDRDAFITGGTAALRDAHTGSCTCQCLSQAGDGAVGNLIGAYGGYRTGEVHFLLYTVTHNDYFFEHFVVLLQCHGDVRLSLDGDFLCHITDVADNQGCIVLYFQREFTVHVSNGAIVRGTFFYHTGSDDSHTCVIEYCTGDGLLCENRCKGAKQHAE